MTMIAGRPAAPAKTKSVLILDGDFMEGGAIRNSLEACGYNVSLWTDAADASERFHARPFELVVLSTNLGNWKLKAFLEELRPLVQPPKVVIIAGEEEKEDELETRNFLRFVAIVNRPYTLLDLTELAECLIGPA